LLPVRGEEEMTARRKTQMILALSVIIAFLFQDCARILTGTSQKIPVTSNPPGAKIIVDGKDSGYAPLNLKLKKTKSHIIRIEKQGYNPLEIRITQKASDSLLFFILGDIFFGGASGEIAAEVLVSNLVFSNPSVWFNVKPNTTATAIIVAGFFIGAAYAILSDFISGANFALSPKELNAALSKVEGESHPDSIVINSEQFQSIKWIRIRSVDSDNEQIINLN
jgi:hypothetical protein